ncbi:MAG: hypothetical protein ETSY1_15300 [Candidatus Entotheonella factor]|uniref:OmpR/PhoB-type domain-containing protein n=2 Tax=Candidatus Entotheonella TaxID=93171 RepID=W4LPL6_ENTF1|nr:MAG: hypothetical protein ETSY1_15300 [Candidatus Entotheonella factor]
MIYRFGDCTFDTARQTLRLTDEIVSVEPQALKVLHYLIENRDHVVSRDELLEQCWPESYISDAALSSCLRRVRQAIGQQRSGQTLIETVHRRGYRFVAEVAEVVETAAPAASPAPSNEPPALAPEPSETEGPVILVVDDDANSRELLEQHLQGRGYATRSAIHGQEALDQVVAEAPDLILLDVRLPVMDGLTVCRQLKSREDTRSIPIILLTALDSPQDRSRGLEAGADAFLTKPVRRQALMAQIETALRDAHAVDDQAPETPPESAASPPAWPPEAAAMPATERRHLTVLSCTLCHADTLPLNLDPEEYYDLTQTFHSTCLEVVVPYDGYVAQQLDDSIVIYFGYPQAHEDDAQRAVRSGLALVEAVRREAMAALNLSGTTVRVGIATGIMVIGSGQVPAPSPSLGVGSASTLAGRLGATARPGTVLIGEATAQLVAGYFECKALEDAGRSGLPESQVVYEVWGESPLQTRLEVESSRGLTPFVGRSVEIALFEERWANVQEGMGQVMLVQGEAGMGKSRLVQVVKEQVVGELTMVWECRCSPYQQNTALYPLIDLAQQALQDAPAGSPRQRDRTLDTLLSLLMAQASDSPLLFIIEDVHWADPSTLDFLHLLMDHAGLVSILVVLTCRPAFQVPWEQRSVMTPVRLNRLTQAQTEQMIMQVAGKSLPASVMAQLVEKTDGTPLFVEELTRMVLESGQLVEAPEHFDLRGELTQLSIPETLHDSLMARLDRLGMAKEVAQWGAVLGRTFSYALLAAVTPFETSILELGLKQLVDAELVFQRGLLPHASYRFKHAMVQEAAYESLLISHRRSMHEQIADVLVAQFTEEIASHPEFLAHHYTEAGRDQLAFEQWQLAGEHEKSRAAYVEASRHLHKALEVLARLPDTPQRAQDELQLQLALGPVLSITQGSASPAYERAYTRARELGEHVGDAAQQFDVLWGLWRLHQARADLPAARELGEQCLRLALGQSDPIILLRAYNVLGASLLLMGEFTLAQTYFERATALYQPPWLYPFVPVDAGLS